MTLGIFPVFPLRNPCFPGQKIPLRVFEDRYVRMLRDIADTRRFVISLISSGEEVGEMATPYRVGTLVEFGETDKQGDFLLIKPQGRMRVYMESFDRESKPYMTADCVAYADENASPASPASMPAGVSAFPEGAADRMAELEASILDMVQAMGPEESRGVREVLEGMRENMDRENYSLFLCGCLHLPPIYLQRLLESRSLAYRMDNALNLLSQRQ